MVNVQRMSRTFSIEVAKDYFNFASAHFLIFANGKREPLHGHNYQVSVKLEGELDRAGVVLDFITFKPIVKQICDSLDHRTLIPLDCPILQIQRRAREIEVRYKRQKIIWKACFSGNYSRVSGSPADTCLNARLPCSIRRRRLPNPTGFVDCTH